MEAEQLTTQLGWKQIERWRPVPSRRLRKSSSMACTCAETSSRTRNGNQDKQSSPTPAKEVTLCEHRIPISGRP
jgi:hypothetical protein